MPQAIQSRSNAGSAARMWALVWIVTYFGARIILEQMGAPRADLGRLAVALVPLIPFFGFLWSFLACMRGADELERRIQLEALAIAYPLATLFIMVLALVQLAMPLNLNDWSYHHVWYFLPIFWVGGQTIARRHYR